MTEFDQELFDKEQSLIYVSPYPVTVDSIQEWLSTNFNNIYFDVIDNVVNGTLGSDNELVRFSAVLDNGTISVEVKDHTDKTINLFTCEEELSLVLELQNC